MRTSPTSRRSRSAWGSGSASGATSSRSCGSPPSSTTSASSRSRTSSCRSQGRSIRREWGFIHSHTLIGQRILSAAPALQSVGDDRALDPRELGRQRLSRRPRRRGDPARRHGSSRVCDAYSAITSDRPYRAARTPEEAVAELRRCAGRQFDRTGRRAALRSARRRGQAGDKLRRWHVTTKGRDRSRPFAVSLRSLVPRRRRRARRRARAGAARERRSRAAGRAPASGRAPCRSSRARRARTRSRSAAR